MTGEPLIVDDMSTESRFAVPAVLREHSVMSEVTVVIDPGGNPFGTLAALSTRRRSFSEHDVSFVQSVANVIATAVERANVDGRVESAREGERSRIARDLHDEALRELSDAFALAAIARSSRPGSEQAQRSDSLIGVLERVDHQLRSAIYDLRLKADEARTFADELRQLVAVQADMAIENRIDLHGQDALPKGSLGHRGTEVLRIIREAIINARSHSGAQAISVEAARSSDDVLRVEITDNGSWPDRDSAISDPRGTGIKGMQERADLLGAELDIGDAPGGGTRVRVELSLAEPT
jgi:signal transduction histidine kinase